MADADAKTDKDRDPIPPVDPEDIKRMWEFERRRNKIGTDGWKWLQDMKAALSPGADLPAVSSRCGMVQTVAHYNRGQLLAPWQHGDELDDAVFRVAAAIPMKMLAYKGYNVAGDDRFGFDPNEFVRQLIEQTGISHTWEPLSPKVPEGQRSFVVSTISDRSVDPDRQAKQKAQEVLWMIFRRFSPIIDSLIPHGDAEGVAHNAAVSFADYLSDNNELVRKVEDWFRTHEGNGIDTLKELEQRARRWPSK